MQGNLRDMAISDLIQHNCQDRKTAQLRIQHSGKQALLFFKDGNVVHAVSGDLKGEEAVYQLLRWEEGKFTLETGVEPPAITISRSWSGLLLEGARRLDESQPEAGSFDPDQSILSEVKDMPKLDEILKEMGGEVTGYTACAVVGLDGMALATHARSKSVDPEAVAAQMTMLLKLVNESVTKLGAGEIEDNLTSTDSAYMLMRFLPGNKQYFLGVSADRKTGNLGNMRLISKMYAERLARAMPR